MFLIRNLIRILSPKKVSLCFDNKWPSNGTLTSRVYKLKRRNGIGRGERNTEFLRFHKETDVAEKGRRAKNSDESVERTIKLAKLRFLSKAQPRSLTLAPLNFASSIIRNNYEYLERYFNRTRPIFARER